MTERLTFRESTRALLPALVLSVVSLLYRCQPSEAYLTPYLLQDKGLSEAELDTWVWPADTIGSLLFFVPVAVGARVLGYRWVVLIGLMFRQATRLILLFVPQGPHCLGWMMVMQLTYAGATCADQVIVALAYRVVERAHYGAATVIMLGSFHAGNLLGSVAAQALVSSALPIRALFWVSWVLSTSALLLFAAWVVAMHLSWLPGGEQLAAADRPLQCCCASRRVALATSAARADGGGRGGGDAVDGAAATRCDDCEPCGARAAEKSRKVLGLYRDARAQLWSLWWLFGWSAAYIVGNYYQQLFINVSRAAPLGLLAALIEASSLLGSYAFGVAPCCVARAPFATIIVGATVCGALVLCATLAPSAAIVDAALIASYGVHHYLLAAAIATIARAVLGATAARGGEQHASLPALSDRASNSRGTAASSETHSAAAIDAALAPRALIVDAESAGGGGVAVPHAGTSGADGPFAAVFALNSCAALALTTVLLRIASAARLMTRGFVFIASGENIVLALLVLALGIGAAGSTARYREEATKTTAL
jgi:hypothetical protein